MSNSKTWRAAAIGRTRGGNYGHGLHLPYKNLDNFEFLAIADENEEGRQKAQEESGAPRAYADYREMLEKEKPEVVSVCQRWTDCHVEMVTACLEAGSHVYCEKPFTASLEEGDQLIAAAEAAGKKIAVAHTAVYLPGVQKLKKLLDGGLIGNVEAIYAHGKQDRRGGGEDMIVLGTHQFNMMRYLAGDVAWLSSHVTVEGRDIEPDDVREPTESVGLVAGDCINTYFAFANGIAGFFDSRRYEDGAGKQRYAMEIVGSEGRISMRGGGGDDLRLYPHPVFSPADDEQCWKPVEDVPEAKLTGNQAAVLDLIEAVENDRKPLSSDRDAVAALEMILGAYESQITGARAKFPMENRRHPLVAWIES